MTRLTDNMVGVVVLIVSCVVLSQTRAEPRKNSIRFLALGDFGGKTDFPFTTPIQNAVSAQTAKFAKENPIDFVLTLGDNFYEHGVESVDDPRFTETYGKVFHQKSLEVDWYIVGGNHDYRGNISAQIAYTKVSKRWKYPDFYYKMKYTIPGSDMVLEIIMIDTVILCGKTDDATDMILLGPASIVEAKKHWKWIRKNIEKSTADYLIVAGHYPVISVSSHGPTKRLVDILDPLLHANNVTAYFSGHDHNLQHLQSRQQQSKVDYFVSGSADKMDPSMEHKGSVPSGALKFFAGKTIPLGGFGHIEVYKENMTFTFSDSYGKELYQHVMFPRYVRK